MYGQNSSQGEKDSDKDLGKLQVKFKLAVVDLQPERSSGIE